MKKLIILTAAAVVIISGGQALQHRRHSFITPAEKLSLRDAPNDPPALAEPSLAYDKACQALLNLLQDKPLCPGLWLLTDDGIACESHGKPGPILLSKSELEKADFWIVHVRGISGGEPRLVKASKENTYYDVALQAGAISNVLDRAKLAQEEKKSAQRAEGIERTFEKFKNMQEKENGSQTW